MITKEDMNQIDQLLEDTFPTGSIPPNGAPVGTGTTTEAASSKDSIGAAPVPAAPVLVEHLRQLGALRHQVKEIEDRVRLVLRAIEDNQAPRTLREKELLGDEIRALWRSAMALDDVLFSFTTGNRWNS